jgi:DNA-3-methyladenine glycosylase I
MRIRSFQGFPILSANYDQRRIQELLANPTIIRNRLKIQSAVTNARAFLKLQQQFGSFDSYLWNFVDGKPKHNEKAG